MALKINQSTQGKDSVLTLDGMIDEQAKLPEFDKPFAGRLMLNLKNVTMINSLGCRSWLKWIQHLKATEGVFLIECSPAFVSQVNILHGFIPNGVSMESFDVPYFCESCSFETAYLFLCSDDPDTVKEQLPCPQCKATMELDAVKPMYFRFLRKIA